MFIICNNYLIRILFYLERLSGFDVAFGVTRWTMVMTGAWPDLKEKDNCLLRYYFLVPTCVISFFCFIPQTTLAIMVRQDFNKLLEVLSTAQILTGMAVFKLIGIRYNNQGKTNKKRGRPR